MHQEGQSVRKAVRRSELRGRHTPLNTDETAEAATWHYDKILHQIIDDIAIMILSFWTEAQMRDPRLRWIDLRLWKMDLKGPTRYYFSGRKTPDYSVCC